MVRRSGMRRPTVSVLLPTHRRPHLVSRAIRSVLAQTLSDWELIVVDDGSKDRTWSVLQAWAKRDSRIRIFRQRHAGVYRAYRTAFFRSRGELIALLNDDDQYLPQHLKRRVAYCRRHPRADFLHGRVCFVGPWSAWWVADVLRPKKLIHLHRCHIGLTFFMRRRAAAVAFGRPHDTYSGDLEIVMDVRRAGLSVHKLNPEFYRTVRYHRTHPLSITHRRRRISGI